jgi:hypothetical protein
MLDDPTAVHHHDFIRQGANDPEVVGYVHKRGVAIADDLADHVQQARLSGDVEAGGRLVHDDQPRPTDEGKRDRDPLLLPAAELKRVTALKDRIVRELGLAQCRGDARPPVGFIRGVDGEHLVERVTDAALQRTHLCVPEPLSRSPGKSKH